MEDCLCVARDEVLRASRRAVSKGVDGAKEGFTGEEGERGTLRRGGRGRRAKGIGHQLFKRKRDKQTVPAAAGRKCKFPARRKDEKRIRARTPRVY